MKTLSHPFKMTGIIIGLLLSAAIQNKAPGAGIEPLQCYWIIAFNDYNGVYECYHVCEDPDDDDSCPDCCASDAGGEGSNSGAEGASSGTKSAQGAGADVPGCGPCNGGNGSGASEGGGGGDACCETGEGSGGNGAGGAQRGAGMAYWSVKQPRLNLFLRDKPFWYRPSRGPQVAFHLHYKNKPGTNTIIGTTQPRIFSVGTNWHTPWRSYLQNTPNNGWTSYSVYAGDGSVIDYIIDVDEPRTGAKLTDNGGQFTLRLNNGEKRIYDTEVSFGGDSAWFLTRIEYAGQVTNRFEYNTNNGSIRLSKVIDTDGRETTFEYTTSGHYSNLISKVVGPFGQTNLLTYANGQLISIKDMMGLESKMEYTNGSLAKLSTPYGTNVFETWSDTNWNALRIVEHNVRTNFYLRADVAVNLFPTATNDSLTLSNYVHPVVAQVAQLDSYPTFVNSNYNERTTFHWGPRQYVNLSPVIFTNLGNGSFAPGNLTTNDFQKGHTRHWLVRPGYQNPTNQLSDTLGLEREPSPNSNGATEGRIIWYDYHTQHTPGFEGNPQRPRVKAWKISADDWQVTAYERAYNGRITARVSNQGLPGAMVWHTNTYTLAHYSTDVTKVSGPDDQNYTRKFNYYHQVMFHTNALGEVTTYSYDETYGRPTAITYPNGLITNYEYDGNGYLSAIIDANMDGGIRTNSYTYTNGLIYAHTDERGLVTTHAYDAFGRLTKMWFPDGTGITNTYDKLDLTTTTDRLGKTTTYVYNSFRQVLQEIDANSPARANTYDYCTCGTLNSVTDPLGNMTSYIYDNAGKRTRITFPGNSYIDFVYDTAHRLIRTTESSGVSVTNWYTIEGDLYTATNAFGRVFYHEDGDWGVRQWDEDWGTYTERARTNMVIDANGVTTRLVYDSIGRLLERIVWEEYFGNALQDRYDYTNNISGPISMNREWAVETAGVMSRTILGEKIRYEYDLFGRKTNEVHENSSGTPMLTNRFKYDISGNLTNLIDGKAQNTSWDYDQYSRLTRKIDHNGTNMFRYTNDANGRLTARWTPEKGTTAYSYDNVGNLTSINYPNSPDITLSYDGNNRLTNMVDAVGTTRFTYAGFGALLSEDGPWENDTVSYTYDNGRRRSGLSVQAPNASAWNQSYTYDSVNRLSVLSSPAGTFTYDYHAGLSGSSPASLVKSITLPNTGAITNHYDTRARMLGTWLRKNDGTLLNKHEYELNDLDQRTKQTRAAGDFVDYTYDALGQLTNAIGKELGGVTNRWLEQFSYGYDAAGNLTNRVQHRLTNTFTVNALNQLTGGGRSGRFSVGGTTTAAATNVTVNTSNSVLYLDYTFASTNHALVNGNNTFTAVAYGTSNRVDTNIVTAYLPASPTLSYDANGNLTNDSQRVFGYDDENQMTNVMVANAWKSEFVYDGKRRRRIRREFTWQNGAWVQTNEVRYVYDGNLAAQERDNFNIAAVSYTRGNDLSGSFEGAGGIRGLIARTDHSALKPQHSYYHADGNGNVTTLIDTNQTVVARYAYGPFGNVSSMIGPVAHANLYRFSSKEAHVPSGLTYYLYRYYDQSLQRWVTRDPIQERGGFNLYQFAGNRPVDYVDPFGHDIEMVMIGAATGYGLLCDAVILTGYLVYKKNLRANECVVWAPRCANLMAAMMGQFFALHICKDCNGNVTVDAILIDVASGLGGDAPRA